MRVIQKDVFDKQEDKYGAYGKPTTANY